jgi:hypothetical protein
MMEVPVPALSRCGDFFGRANTLREMGGRSASSAVLRDAKIPALAPPERLLRPIFAPLSSGSPTQRANTPAKAAPRIENI